MSYSGQPNQHRPPQAFGGSQPPPHGYHAPPGYNTAAPPPGYNTAAPPPGYNTRAPPGYNTGAPPSGGQYGAPPPSYAGYNPGQQAYQAAPPHSYTPGQQPPASGYGAPGAQTGYSQYGAAPPAANPPAANPPAANPPASNPYATAHTGAPGYPSQIPPAPTVPQCPPGVDPTLWQVFKVVDTNNSNSITALELQQALTNNNWTQFNSETCRLLIGQFDQNKDGSIDIYEFSHLWKYIQDWRQCFESFDTDKSGTIDVNELQQAFQSFGYRLSMDFCQLCTRVFDRSDKHTMSFDSFIQCCVLMRSLTDSFRRRDTNLNGQIDVSYEDFLDMVIDNTVTT